MKIGDIVIQEKDLMLVNGTETVEEVVGIVIEVHDWKINNNDYPDEILDYQRRWLDKLGRRIDVLWASGKVTKSFAENSLRVVE